MYRNETKVDETKVELLVTKSLCNVYILNVDSVWHINELHGWQRWGSGVVMFSYPS